MLQRKYKEIGKKQFGGCVSLTSFLDEVSKIVAIHVRENLKIEHGSVRNKLLKIVTVFEKVSFI